jgi:mannose-6-phosphate isomerase
VGTLMLERTDVQMLVSLKNLPRNYAWGSKTAIAEMMGWEASGEPEAELWLGAHPGSPSVIVNPALTGGAIRLDEWVAADPQTTLGPFAATRRLPFLLKILAAAAPLSLQAHPSSQRAVEGFERENVQGISLDAAYRNYKDPYHKPEMLYALSDTFEVLCGFRSHEDAEAIIASLGDEETQKRLAPFREKLHNGLESVVEWLLRNDVANIVDAVVDAARHMEASVYDRELATVRLLAETYPGDPGIVLSLLLNRVSLKRGEVLYLPAGNIHAYLEGLGVEIMASSDNVLRGGLTPKHIDVDELLDVLEFRPLPVPYVRPAELVEGIDVYRPDVPDFALVRVEVGGQVPETSFTVGGPAIAMCTSGEVLMSGVNTSMLVGRGESLFVTPDEATVVFSGLGVVFLATVNV